MAKFRVTGFGYALCVCRSPALQKQDDRLQRPGRRAAPEEFV